MADVALGLLTPLGLHFYLLKYILATEYEPLPIESSGGSRKKERT